MDKETALQIEKLAEANYNLIMHYEAGMEHYEKTQLIMMDTLAMIIKMIKMLNRAEVNTDLSGHVATLEESRALIIESTIEYQEAFDATKHSYQKSLALTMKPLMHKQKQHNDE